jgi:alcohol dehydrogenase
MAATVTNSPFTDGLAMESTKLLFQYLPRATANGEDMEARAATLVASTMAGAAFTNAGVGIVHALAHATGARFNTHHGMTNAVYLPHGMRFNLAASSGIYAEIARGLGFSLDLDDNKASLALIDAVEKLLKEVGLPLDLKSLGVPRMNEDELNEWVALVAEDAAFIFNPVEASSEDIKGIFERAY